MIFKKKERRKLHYQANNRVIQFLRGWGFGIPLPDSRRCISDD